MKFHASAKSLYAAASAALKLLDKKHDLFSQVALVAKAGGVFIHATNGSHYLVYEIEGAVVEKPGQVLLPGVRTAHLLSKLSGQVSVSRNRSQLEVHAGDVFSIKIGKAKHYPPVPAEGGADQPHVFLDGAELKRLISETSYAAMQSENGVGLCGVYLCAQDGKAEAVATDGVSFARSEMPATGTLTGHTDPVSLTGLEWLQGNLNAGDQAVLRRLDSYWLFHVGPRRLWVGRAARKFPDYNQLLNNLRWSHKLSLDRKSLNAGLQRTLAMFGSKEPQKTVELQASTAGLSILASSEYGKSSVQVDGELDGEPANISIDAYRLSSALRMLRDQDNVTLHIGDERSPVKLDSLTRDNHLALVAVVVPSGA